MSAWPDASPVNGWAVFLDSSLTGLVVGSALVAFTAARLCAREASLLQRVLGFGVWSAALLVGCAEALSSIGQLHWPAALVLSALGAAVVRWCLPEPAAESLVCQIARARAVVPAPETAWLLAFAAPALAWGLFSAWLSLVSAEPPGDNTTYHLPRLAYWMQHQTLAYFPSNDPRISTFPVAGNLVQLWPALFLRRERLCALVQLASHLGTALAVYAAARRLGAARPASAAAAFCWLAIPVALVQAASSNVDLVAAFFTVAACALALGCLRDGTAWTAYTCVASAALAVGTKPQTLPLAAACALVALVSLRGARRRHLLPSLLLAILLAGMQPWRNAQAVGSPSGLASVRWVMLNPGLPTLAKNAQLVALPLTGGAGLWRQFPPWSLPETLLAHGLGVLWPIATAGAASAVLFGRRPFRDRGRVPPAYALLAAGYAIAVLGVMRHQPSVDRFFLPAAAALTPLVSAVFVGRVRTSALAIVWAIGCGALFHRAQSDFTWRSSRSDGGFLRYSDVAGSDWHSLARACERLAAGGRGRRIGIVTAQTMPQRLLLGSRFQNVLVPLSHDPPLVPETLEQLRLDAFYLDAGGTLDLQLFRHPWVPPPSGRDRWRMSAREGFDEDYARAYLPAVRQVGFERTALLLGRAGSGWELDSSVRCNGLYFVRGAGSGAAVGIVHATSPYGIQELHDHSLFGLGSERTFLKVFSAEEGTAFVAVRFPQGTAPAPGAMLEARLAGQAAASVPLDGPDARVPVPLRAGIGFMSLRITGPSTPGAARVALTWDGPARARDGSASER
jgi:hypothetical protein